MATSIQAYQLSMEKTETQRRQKNITSTK